MEFEENYKFLDIQWVDVWMVWRYLEQRGVMSEGRGALVAHTLKFSIPIHSFA